MKRYTHAQYVKDVQASAVAIFMHGNGDTIYFCPTIKSGRELARQIRDEGKDQHAPTSDFIARLPDQNRTTGAWPYHAQCETIDLLD